MTDLSPIKQISIIEVAKRLGIEVYGTKAMCFNGHDRESPSLSFYKRHNTWRCFGSCDKHGDGIALVMEKEGLDFKSALEWFARNFGIDVPSHSRSQPRRGRALSEKKDFAVLQEKPEQQEFVADPELYEFLISRCTRVSSDEGIAYLQGHGISKETAENFNLRELRDPTSLFQELVEVWGGPRVYCSGVALGNMGRPTRLIWNSPALLFPFYENNHVVYIQARMLVGSPKFLNPRSIPKPMFNLDRLRNRKPGQLVHLCEGAPDAVALESNHLAAVGILGATSFRSEWVDHFLMFTVVVLGDGDDAGARFAKKIIAFFMDRGKAVQYKLLPKGKDVADVLAEIGRPK
ncbi:MAG: toprim domain-containing protein [Ignavibacteria bacterium]|nr:toprim domain-containing protein [Ignavibacteria bacterium]